MDLRLAERLLFYAIPGTFYVPLNPSIGHVLTKSQIRDLRQSGMEIGSHTVNHPVLTEVRPDAALYELVESKKRLEDVLGESVTSFCYPEGEFNSTLRSLTIQAGYRLARTTINFRSDLHFDPFGMPVSLQCLPRSRKAYLRTALRQRNFRGIITWFGISGMESDLSKLSLRILDHIEKNGGILHLWGHSWEIEELGLWGLLDDVLREISNRRNILYRTNSEVLDLVSRADKTSAAELVKANRSLS